MNNKIPCGGFELNDSLTLDSEKKLGVNWEGQVQSDWEQNNENAPDYIKNRLCYEEMGIVHQLDSKYIPGTTYWVRLGYDGDNGKYIVDKSYDDIKMAIDDGKYVALYDPEEHYVFQLAHHSSNGIRFTRATPYLISQVEIESDNAVSCDEINLEGSKNWLCSYNVDGLMTSVESLDYIKLNSPNGTLYTISVTDDGTIQAQVKP